MNTPSHTMQKEYTYTVEDIAIVTASEKWWEAALCSATHQIFHIRGVSIIIDIVLVVYQHFQKGEGFFMSIIINYCAPCCHHPGSAIE